MQSWMSAFALTLGEFERETYEESLLVAFVFHYFTIFVNIVLLNVLIAIISDTYERVEEKGKARGLLMRARLLLEMQVHPRPSRSTALLTSLHVNSAHHLY